MPFNLATLQQSVILPNQAPNPYSTQLFVTGPLNPYSQLYRPIRRGNRNQQSGGLLLSTPTLSQPQWWHVNVFCREAVLRTESFEQLRAAGQLEQLVKGGAIGEALVAQSGQPAISQRGTAGSQISALKIRMEYVEYPTQRRRSLVCDIGSGFDVPLGPTQQIDIDLLAPEPLGYELAVPNVGSDVNELRFASWVVATAQPCPDGTQARDIGLRFTQAVAIPGEEENPDGFTDVPLRNDVRKVQIFSQGIATTPPPAQWIPVTDGAQFPEVAGNFNQGAFGFIPDVGHTFVVDAPQNQKAIRLSRVPGQGVTVYQVVQELQL